MGLIGFGAALMVSAALPLAGVLHAWHHRLVQAFHQAAVDDVFSGAKNWVTRRHLRRPCGTCSLLADLATAHVRRP